MHRLTRFVLILVTITVGMSSLESLAADARMDTRAEDYAEIQTLIVKYAHVYDARDVEGYVSVFTDDVKFTFNGGNLNGIGEVREFITNVANSPEPAMKSYHSISNTLIEFVSDTEAHHRSYWQIIMGPYDDGQYIVGNMGVYEDVIVKENGKWLIKQRNIPF